VGKNLVGGDGRTEARRSLEVVAVEAGQCGEHADPAA
jgi:hypothetical protein